MTALFEELKRAQNNERNRQFRTRDLWDRLWEIWREQSGCPSDEKIAAYFDNRLSFLEASKMRWHIRHCTLCAEETQILRTILSEIHEEKALFQYQCVFRRMPSTAEMISAPAPFCSGDSMGAVGIGGDFHLEIILAERRTPHSSCVFG